MKVFDYVNLTPYKQVINLPTRVIRPMPRVPVALEPGEAECREIVVKCRPKAKMGKLVERETEPSTERPTGDPVVETQDMPVDEPVNEDEAEDNTAEKEE